MSLIAGQVVAPVAWAANLPELARGPVQLQLIVVLLLMVSKQVTLLSMMLQVIELLLIGRVLILPMNLVLSLFKVVRSILVN